MLAWKKSAEETCGLDGLVFDMRWVGMEVVHFALYSICLFFLLGFDFAGHLVLLAVIGSVRCAADVGRWCRIQSGIALAWKC